MTWAMFGKKEPCDHLLALRAFMLEHGIEAWSEQGEEPWGWLNVSCPCPRTYETTLRAPWNDEAED